MELKWNGNIIKQPRWNGVDLKELRWNGSTVWKEAPQEVVFSYTGAQQIFIPSETGVYEITATGAQGNTLAIGFPVPKIVANVNLTAGTSYYINIGGYQTGWPDGGTGGYIGAGSTSINTSATFVQANCIMILGGAGHQAGHNAQYGMAGKAIGTFNGMHHEAGANGYSTNTNYGGRGATITAPGAATPQGGGTAGTLNKGGSGRSAPTYRPSGSGGGGYYGGGGGGSGLATVTPADPIGGGGGGSTRTGPQVATSVWSVFGSSTPINGSMIIRKV